MANRMQLELKVLLIAALWSCLLVSAEKYSPSSSRRSNDAINSMRSRKEAVRETSKKIRKTSQKPMKLAKDDFDLNDFGIFDDDDDDDDDDDGDDDNDVFRGNRGGFTGRFDRDDDDDGDLSDIGFDFSEGMSSGGKHKRSSRFANDDDDDDEVSPDDIFSGLRLASGDKDALYDAYNQLHTLAQEYAKPFDAPAVVVVGHQSSGKSALIEALMGFQFNQVGGGTKTRRPIALRMQYNPKYSTPKCYLLGEDGVERPMSLSDIQDYIERENRRLERDPVRSFDSREIHVRVEYKYCPNMILIDTPGLISAPRVPKGRQGSGSALAQQRALQASAREAERLVVEKMRCEDYIILCVEDTNDWKHGATREVVQKADADLSRTVIVNTKFDTKIPQFGTPSDVEGFLRASILDKISPHRLGGPFFTSVPSGRVGRIDEIHREKSDFYENFVYDKDDDFVHGCGDAESADRSVVLQRLRRINKGSDPIRTAVMGRIGLTRLRTFLEDRVEECYRRNVDKIIPMLQAEHMAAERRLQACEKELDALSIERLKAGADTFCDEFCVNLKKAMQGSIVAPASIFGETMAQENIAAGSFHAVQGCPMAVSDRTWDRLVETEVGNTQHRLYGGSQYHRTLREFHLATKCLRLPSISEDEIANAAGIGDTHDGVNFLHAACVIALEKARLSFEPMISALQIRMTHVMERLYPVTEYMLRENRERSRVTNFKIDDDESRGSGKTGYDKSMDISQNAQFRQLIRSLFDKFVQQCAASSMSKCRDDLSALTRFVTWSLDERSSGALTHALPDRTDMFAVYQVAVQNANKPSLKGGKATKVGSGGGQTLTATKQPTEGALSPIPQGDKSVDRDYNNLLQLMEESLMDRDSNRTNLVVGGLVQHIVSQWRDQFCRSVTTKFNCYFMLPFVEDFHRFLRTELRKVYDGEQENLTDVFDLAAVRRSLQVQRDELRVECQANKKLQAKFQNCSRMLSMHMEENAGASITLTTSSDKKKGR